MSVQFLKISKRASWFGIVPFCNDQKNARKKSVKGYYSLALLTIFVSWYCYELYTIHCRPEKLMHEKLTVLLLTLKDLFCICFFSAIFLVAILQRRNWRVLLRDLSGIERRISLKVKNNSRCIYVFYSFLLHLGYLLLSFEMAYSVNIHIGFNIMSVCRFIMIILFQHYEIFFAGFTCFLINILINKYRSLTEMIKLSMCHSDVRIIRSRLRQVQDDYVELFLLTSKFNNIIQWPIFFLYIDVCMHILIAAYFSINSGFVLFPAIKIFFTLVSMCLFDS